ncbi:MAG: AMP-binding protein [Desulfatibacillum sp.]|nr:AMP-binding protein [Desulfatibacillum sp.]
MNQTHFPFWPKRVPKELIYPQTPLFEFLETSANRYPDHPAIIYYGRKIKYSELWDSCLRLSGVLAGMGVKKGDRVAIYMQNCPHFAISYLGGMRANGVVVPLNPMLVDNELRTLLTDCGAKVVITTTELYPRISGICAELGVENVIVGSLTDYVPDDPELPVPDFMASIPTSIEGALNWLEALASAPEPPPVEVGPEDLCLLPYTAGSTGIPKGCMHTHRSVTSNVMGGIYWANGAPGLTVLAALPFFHVTGMIHSFLAPIAMGGTSIYLTRWDRTAALDAIEKYKVVLWANITTMLIDLLAAPDINERDISSLGFVGGGGAPLPQAVGEKFNKMTGLQFAEGYGMTETISQTHWNPPDNPKLGSVGIPVFGVDARIVDVITLKELPQGEQGEIVVNGPQILKGYWNKPDADKDAFMEIDGKQFLRTGDIGRVDEEGYFYIMDRVKRMINAAGFKVWPADVEATLYRHPAVLEACVIGIPDDERVETVKAIIVLNKDQVGKVTDKDIIAWSKEQMSAYKYPRFVEFVEALPKSGAGKILWRQLQEDEREKLKK